MNLLLSGWTCYISRLQHTRNRSPAFRDNRAPVRMRLLKIHVKTFAASALKSSFVWKFSGGNGFLLSSGVGHHHHHHHPPPHNRPTAEDCIRILDNSCGSCDNSPVNSSPTTAGECYIRPHFCIGIHPSFVAHQTVFIRRDNIEICMPE